MIHTASNRPFAPIREFVPSVAQPTVCDDGKLPVAAPKIAQTVGLASLKLPQDPMPHNRYLPNDLSPAATLRLVALPYAGGGAAPYYRWRQTLDSRIELVPIQLPGREGRISEPPLTDLGTLVTEIANAMTPVLDRPYAILGHSMGGTIAFELAREMRRRSERLPELLIVAASAAPHQQQSEQSMSSLSDDAFIAEMNRRFHGIPSAVLEHKELLQLLLPALRADMALLETYKFLDEPPLDLEILALGGTEDRAVSRTQLAEWRRHTSANFSQRMFPGGHFFLFPASERSPAEVPAAVRTIADRLSRLMEG
jgi:medium-chain acyl-[acyl-carrier-protein] hydrolase